MEIIIHGKPNSVGSKSTSGIDSLLKDRIEDNFFRNMSLFEGKESMYVDAWNWRGKWYCVYTYLLYDGIRDTAKRPSYFALSLIIPDQYCCLVSEVYNLLKKVTSSIIIGGFIDKTGKYILDTFQNDSLFNSVVNEVTTNYVNLAENFDNEFKPQSEFSNNLKYSLKDCDSKAFVDALKQYGRVIVSESVPTKDSLLASNEQARQELSRVKSTIQEKDGTIVQLNKQLEELSERMSSSGKKKDDEIKRLQMNIDELESGKQSLLEEKGKILEGWKEVEDALSKFPLMDKHMSQKPVAQGKENFVSKYLPYVPFLNTVLIFVLAFICFSVARHIGYTPSKDENLAKQVVQYKEKNEALQGEINNLNIEINKLKNTLEEQTNNIEQSSTEVQRSTIDVDCNFVAKDKTKNVRLTNNAQVDNGDTIVVTFTAQPSYEIHLSGATLANGSHKDTSPCTLIVSAERGQGVVVAYRSSSKSNKNPKNEISLNIK